jgi:hypothetical protein
VPEVNVGRHQVSDALVILQMVVVSDEIVDPLPEFARAIAVLVTDTVLEGLLPALDLALGLRMQRSTLDTTDQIQL